VKNIDEKNMPLQINFLEDLSVNTQNGYIWGSDGTVEGKWGSVQDASQPAPSNIENISAANAEKFKIGYHSGIQVVFGATYKTKTSDTQDFFYDPSQIIDQVFAAALNLGQEIDLCPGADDDKAKLILEWTYEATLKSAFLNGKRDENGKIKVFLTRMGGGVFANKQEWIDEAIKRAIDDQVLANSGLEVTLNNFVFDKESDAGKNTIRTRLADVTKRHGGVYKLYKFENNKSIETQL